MGCSSSKGTRVAAAATAVPELTELYKEACRLLTKFEQLSTAEEPPAIAGVTALRFASATEFKKVVLKNPTTLSFVICSLKHVVVILNSITNLKQCLDKAVQCQAVMRAAVESYDKENNTNKKTKKKRKKKTYTRILSMLEEESKKAKSLLANVNTEALQAVCNQQQSLYEALHERKHEIKKRLTSTKKWRKVWNVAYTIFFMVFLTGSVVFAALAAPPAAITAATAAATAIKAIEPFFNTLWDELEGDLEAEKEVIKSMRRGGEAAQELESIRTRVEKVKVEILSVTEGVEFEVGEENIVAVNHGVMEKRKNIEEAQEVMEELQKKVDHYEYEFLKLTTEFLKIIANEM